MDGRGARQHHARVRVLPPVKKLDDCLGDFLVRVTYPCGVSRRIEPEALARPASRKVTLAPLASGMRCSRCGKKIAEVVAVVRPRPHGGRTAGVGQRANLSSLHLLRTYGWHSIENVREKYLNLRWKGRDSNPQPRHYESATRKN